MWCVSWNVVTCQLQKRPNHPRLAAQLSYHQPIDNARLPAVATPATLWARAAGACRQFWPECPAFLAMKVDELQQEGPPTPRQGRRSTRSSAGRRSVYLSPQFSRPLRCLDPLLGSNLTLHTLTTHQKCSILSLSACRCPNEWALTRRQKVHTVAQARRGYFLHTCRCLFLCKKQTRTLKCRLLTLNFVQRALLFLTNEEGCGMLLVWCYNLSLIHI